MNRFRVRGKAVRCDLEASHGRGVNLFGKCYRITRCAASKMDARRICSFPCIRRIPTFRRIERRGLSDSAFCRLGVARIVPRLQPTAGESCLDAFP